MKKYRIAFLFVIIASAFIIALLLRNLTWVCEGYESQVPKYIWQTYKSKKLPRPAQEARETWISNNPSWTCELYDDADIENYIKGRWENRMYNFFKAVPVGVMKADIWRYLILKTHGGVYSDIDSQCLKPIIEWEDEQQFSTDDVLMIGLENNVHFCQWTIYSTKEHPAMKYICDYILTAYETNGIDTSDPDFVHKTTGPGIWTDAIISFLEKDSETDSTGKTPGQIFEEYKKNPEPFNNRGIYLLSKNHYDNIYSKNLYGSQNFDDGYVKWKEEANALNLADT